jgi:hypothetical protein
MEILSLLITQLVTSGSTTATVSPPFPTVETLVQFQGGMRN